eukprot:2899857-Prymnesium_polylepis.1
MRSDPSRPRTRLALCVAVAASRCLQLCQKSDATPNIANVKRRPARLPCRATSRRAQTNALRPSARVKASAA